MIKYSLIMKPISMHVKTVLQLLLSIILFATAACGARQYEDQSIRYKVGDRGSAGGWVFHDKGYYSEGWRYLEAAPDDQCDSIAWHTGNKIRTGASGKRAGDGRINTLKIIQSQGSGMSAAKICWDYRGGGKSDWYLPSLHELDLIFENLVRYNKGGFKESSYWSSTEYDEGNAYARLLHVEKMRRWQMKENEEPVRAVRAF